MHIEESEREELAENFSGMANKLAGEYIEKYNKLVHIVRTACELSSNDDDSYGKHETNKTNIRMQARYLYDNKGLIDKNTSDDIINLQTFRNKIVHQVGIVSISESELAGNSLTLDTVIETLSSLKLEDITSKKGINLRNTK
ncbi:hypothetical protein [Aeromonas rivipollensis]|nr:hypothetical protein [Aeromonas rivipollensis]MDM5121865.1 hypothetical protein [Aeromonas rivipollensis]